MSNKFELKIVGQKTNWIFFKVFISFSHLSQLTQGRLWARRMNVFVTKFDNKDALTLRPTIHRQATWTQLDTFWFSPQFISPCNQSFYTHFIIIVYYLCVSGTCLSPADCRLIVSILFNQIDIVDQLPLWHICLTLKLWNLLIPTTQSWFMIKYLDCSTLSYYNNIEIFTKLQIAIVK